MLYEGVKGLSRLEIKVPCMTGSNPSFPVLIAMRFNILKIEGKQESKKKEYFIHIV